MISIITGGAGFIGSHLAEYLVSKKHKVYVVDNFSNGQLKNLIHIKDKIKIVKADISSYQSKWTKIFLKADFVFHLAALADIVPSIEEPRNYFNSNVIGTFNVLEACRQNKKIKFLYAASSSCYGIPKNYPTTENTKIDCKYPYALTKHLGEELVMHWCKIYQLKAFSVRLFNIYGTRSRTNGTYGAVFGVFLAQKLKKIPFTIVGDGNQTRDFTYVSDVVDAMMKVIKSKYYGEIFNIGSNKSVSVNKIAQLLKGKKIYIPKRPGEPDKTFASIVKIKKYLNWKPKVDINKGIKELLINIDYWKKAPVWTPAKIKLATKSWFKNLK
jgi:UDP-glucose 4-epimerase